MIDNDTALDTIVDSYWADLTQAISRVDRRAMGEAVALVVHTLSEGRQVLLAGNGGSAAGANHLACDWNAACSRFDPRPRVMSLSADPTLLTALANDHGFTESFAYQIDAWGRPADLVVLLSVSGSSPNIDAAAKAARRRSMGTLGVLGSAGAATASVDHLVLAGEEDYGIAEDMQVSFGHMVVRAVRGGVRHRLAERRRQ